LTDDGMQHLAGLTKLEELDAPEPGSPSAGSRRCAI
jgi:hypothetical protein